MSFFNTTGPCFPEDHYMLPPECLLLGAQLHRYINDNIYWVLYAQRRAGKTTFLINWMHEMNVSGQVVACYVSVERCQGIPDIVRSMPSVCAAIRQYAEAYKLPTPDMPTSAPGDMLSVIMIDWSQKVAPKPLVVLFDEVDTLEGETMVSFLRQLRGGFASRGVGEFPVSIALVGMRDLRDYIMQSKDGVSPNPGSPFNIKEDSAVIKNFTESDIAELFAQRTAENGQQITQEALDYVWEQSGGQPWIVNNLFKRATMRILDVESTETVSLTHVEQARKQMIEARETHLDALAYRMQDKRVRTVIETILTGETNTNLMLDAPEVQLALDLGLVVYDPAKGLHITNPIYTEILTRMLNSGMEIMLQPPKQWKWQKPDGSLDMDKLLREFVAFWRRHSEVWESKSDYTEAFPHLLLLAFMQRLFNGEGRIDREAAAGRGRLDLLAEYKDYKCVIEIKLWHDYDSYDILREEAIEQTLEYRDRFGASTPAYLLIFDRRSPEKKAPWEERLKWEENVEGITIIGL